MFNYDGVTTPAEFDPETAAAAYTVGAHTYRPDLVGLIRGFLRVLPEDCWPLVVCFRTGCRGEFVVKFQVADGAGRLRFVELLIDHGYSEISTDSRDWVFDYPCAPDLAMLQEVANKY